MSANLNGGGAAGSNSGTSSLSPLTPLILCPRSSSPSTEATLNGALTFSPQFLSLKPPVGIFVEGNLRSVPGLPECRNLIFAGLRGIGPVLGLGKFRGRGFKPHSDKTQLAMGDPEGAHTRVLWRFFFGSLSGKGESVLERDRERVGKEIIYREQTKICK